MCLLNFGVFFPIVLPVMVGCFIVFVKGQIMLHLDQPHPKWVYFYGKTVCPLKLHENSLFVNSARSIKERVGIEGTNIPV